MLIVASESNKFGPASLEARKLLSELIGIKKEIKEIRRRRIET
jgi:hypothetical protein